MTDTPTQTNTYRYLGGWQGRRCGCDPRVMTHMSNSAAPLPAVMLGDISVSVHIYDLIYLSISLALSLSLAPCLSRSRYLSLSLSRSLPLSRYMDI